MVLFTVVTSVLVISDFIVPSRESHFQTRDYVFYFILTAITLTGAWFYYGHPNVSFASRVLSAAE